MMDISWFCPIIVLSGNIIYFFFGESVLRQSLVPVVWLGFASLTLLRECVIKAWPISVTKIGVGMDTSL